MSKATPIAILMVAASAFSSPVRAQAPLKTKPSAKSDEPTYMITAHTVVHDESTNSQLDNYVIVYGSEVLRVQYAESQISTVKPGASKLEQVAPGKNLHWHTRFGRWPQEPDVSQVPQVGVPIRACEMDTKYPDNEGHPVIAIQSVSAPCMSRNGDTLHYVLAPNGGIKTWEYVNFDVLEVTNSDLAAGIVPKQVATAPTGRSANVGVAAPESAPPRKDIPAIAKAANGAIVSIVMSDKDSHAIAQGSGFLISNDGMILTNYHVIAEGSSAVVKLPDGTLYVVDGVLASDKVRDVAVIKVHGSNFRTLTLGNSDQLQVGEEVVAIGNPLSLESTVSNGILSGIRTVEEEGGKFLQVTTPISPGSSGGPLFNMAGEVIGITTMYLKGGENLNFAIPINDAKRLFSNQSAKLQSLPNEAEPKEVSERTPKESPQDTRHTINDITQWMTKSIYDNDNPTRKGEVAVIRGHFGRADGEKAPGKDCYVLTQETIVDVLTYVDLVQTEDFFNLHDIDPNTVVFHEYPQGIYEFTAKTTNNEPKIRSKFKTDFVESHNDYARISEVQTDSVSFQLDPDYGPRFTKAFKQAVILCGGEPSIF